MLLKNIFFLYVSQLANYIVPLVTLPYLSRVLGVSVFGEYAVAQSIISILSIIIDWGFAISATQLVARNQQNSAEIRRAFWSIQILKTIILTLVTITIFIIAELSLIHTTRMTLTCIIVNVICYAYSAGWLLQGMEKMRFFATSTLVGRLAALPLTFIFVTDSRSLEIALLIQAAATSVSTITSLYSSNKLIPLFPIYFNFGDMMAHLRRGAGIFFAMGAINIYTQFTIVLLSVLSNQAAVGTYSAPDRVRRAILMLLGPATSAIFPRINNLLDHDRRKASRVMLTTLCIQSVIGLLLSGFMFFFADRIIQIAFGAAYAESADVLRVTAPVIFLVSVSSVLGINILIPTGRDRAFSFIVGCSAVISFVAMCLLAPTHGAIGAATAMLLAELWVTIAMSVVVFRSDVFR